MRAVQLIEPGQPLEEREAEVEHPGPGQVLVRIVAAGVCRSDAHYRKGFPGVARMPITLGHEIAGVVEAAGAGVTYVEPGRRVAIHYRLSCGVCAYCRDGSDQFCARGAMLGKDRDGGYAEFITVPEANVFPIPEGVLSAHAAVMMCSTATAYHALCKGRLQAGERVAVFGVGGLGMSAVQLATALGAETVFAVDVNPAKTELAKQYGAEPIDVDDAAAAIRSATGGQGVDVALELAGLTETTRAGLDALGPMGRLVVVGLNGDPVPLYPYEDLVTTEKEIIGNSDHLSSEIPELLGMAESGDIDLTGVVTGHIPLTAEAINDALDGLEAGSGEARTVVEMEV
jgi:propanol-preferring alcohol dehydrogenase